MNDTQSTQPAVPNMQDETQDMTFSQTGSGVTKSSVIVFLLATAVIFGFSGYFLGRNSISDSKNQMVGDEQISDSNQQAANETTTPLEKVNTEQVSVVSFYDTVMNNCTDGEIALTNLPFLIDLETQKTYEVTDSISCFDQDEGYARLSFKTGSSDVGGIRDIFFFHEKSNFMGMRNILEPLDDYQQVSINGRKYWTQVQAPGPYGISSLGLWVKLIAEKQDEKTGTIVRDISLTVLKDEEFIDLVKKYGTETDVGASTPLYIVDNPEKEELLVSEFVAKVPTIEALQDAAEGISSDMDGILFK